MKAIVPHPFFRYAAKFTLNSIIAGISNLGSPIIKAVDSLRSLAIW